MQDCRIFWAMEHRTVCLRYSCLRPLDLQCCSINIFYSRLRFADTDRDRTRPHETYIIFKILVKYVHDFLNILQTPYPNCHFYLRHQDLVRDDVTGNAVMVIETFQWFNFYSWNKNFFNKDIILIDKKTTSVQVSFW